MKKKISKIKDVVVKRSRNTYGYDTQDRGKKIMALNIKLIRLLNGDEILGEIIDTTEADKINGVFAILNKVTVRNPVRVVVMPSKNDPKTPTVGFAPWAQFTDDKEFLLDKSHILAIMEPITEFRNQYNGMFGGVLTQPKRMIIP